MGQIVQPVHYVPSPIGIGATTQQPCVLAMRPSIGHLSLVSPFPKCTPVRSRPGRFGIWVDMTRPKELVREAVDFCPHLPAILACPWPLACSSCSVFLGPHGPRAKPRSTNFTQSSPIPTGKSSRSPRSTPIWPRQSTSRARETINEHSKLSDEMVSMQSRPTTSRTSKSTP